MSPRLIRDLYESGCSLREVAEMSGLTKSTARYRLLSMGVELRGRGGNRRCPPHEEYARTAFMYEHMGMSTYEIAEELGIYLSTVQNRLKQHGVQMRPREESVRLRWSRRPKRNLRRDGESSAA